MKKRNLYINGKRIYLREIQISDANTLYCSWLNDPRVNTYLCSRFERWTVPKLTRYIKEIKKDSRNCFWAICRKDTNSHIGNIKLGPINRIHKYGDIGIMIGDRSSWGKGFATEAIKLVKGYAFSTLRLHKLTAGAYSKNYGSIKAFQKTGFYIEGVRKKQLIINKRYSDQVLLACIRD